MKPIIYSINVIDKGYKGKVYRSTWLIFVLLLFIPEFIPAQIEVKLPSRINVTINNSEFEPSETWNDSLIEEAARGHIRYEIVSTYRNLSNVTTRIRIPQFYTLPEVMRQIIIYYCLLNDESDRQNEILLIYPFFMDIHQRPLIICTYEKENQFNLTISEWQTVPIPQPPIPEHKFLYNQLIEADLTELTSRDTIPDEIYEQVADKNNVSVDQLQRIYQSVKLWQLAQ